MKAIYFLNGFAVGCLVAFTPVYLYWGTISYAFIVIGFLSAITALIIKHKTKRTS